VKGAWFTADSDSDRVMYILTTSITVFNNDLYPVNLVVTISSADADKPMHLEVSQGLQA